MSRSEENVFFNLEKLLSNCFFPLFRGNLTAKFDKKQERFQEIPGVFNNIPWNLLEHSPESLITFPGIFNNIPRNPLEQSPESSGIFSE